MLASDFERWKKAVEKSLKGVPFDTKFKKWSTLEGVPLQVVYGSENGRRVPQPFSVLRRSVAQWQRGCFVHGHSPHDANLILIQNLSLGITHPEVNVQVHDLGSPLGLASVEGVAGVALHSPHDLATLSKGISLEMAPLRIWVPNVESKKVLMSWLPTVFGKGPYPEILEDFSFGNLLAPTSQSLLGSSALRNMGSNAVNEIALLCFLYARQTLQQSKGQSAVEIRTGLSNAVFEDACKLRALRLALNRIKEYSKSDLPFSIHALVCDAGFTVEEPWNNALRATGQAFAAVVGTADKITLLPHSRSFESLDEALLAHRLSCNVHNLLEEESHLGEVNDPANGAWFFDSLTSDLSEKSWKIFQDWCALEIPEVVFEEFRKAALADLESNAQSRATRKIPILGSSVFPEHSPSKKHVSQSNCVSFDQEFLALKVRVANQLLKSPDKKIHLVVSENKAKLTARLNWVRDLISLVSISVEEGSVASTFANSGPVIFVANDEDYNSMLASARLNSNLFEKRVWSVATNPSAHPSVAADATRATSNSTFEGVTQFVFSGCNVIRFFESLLELPKS
jgi:hypothetical protein